MKLLAIDYSTSCTGWSVFEEKELTSYGFIKNKAKKQKHKLRNLLKKLEFMASQILELVDNLNPDIIVIEEIAGSKQRLGQKTLDMGHGFVLKALEALLDRVFYMDVTGKEGWRFYLQLRLSEEDKINNKESRKINKSLAKGTKKLPIIGPKHLVVRYVNEKYGLNLNFDENTSDGDIADSVGLGTAFLHFKLDFSEHI